MNEYRAIFLSDAHLGMRGSQPDKVVDFLKNNESDILYLNGDILDLLALRRYWYWPDANNEVIKLIVDKANNGTKVYYVLGNHDTKLDKIFGRLVNIEVVDRIEHIGLNEKRYLVVHGHEFDSVIDYAPWLVNVGNVAYDFMFVANRILNKVRHFMGRDYWSLAQWTKTSVKSAVTFIGDFQKAMIAEARHGGYDGIILGHIHHPAQETIDGIEYLNSGDWIESFSCVVENYDKTFEIKRY